MSRTSVGPEAREAEDRLRRAGEVMRVDVITAEVVRELRADGLRPVVLKGPAIARWLYDAIGDRAYVDTDLLLAPSEQAAGEDTLRRLGFEPGQTGWLAKSREWRRGTDLVDLHASLWGIEADDAAAWELLTRDPGTVAVGGLDAEALGPPARALHLALHAAQHESGFPRPRADLERALAVVPRETWREAAALARALGAAGTLAAGLRRVGADALVGELGLAGTPSPAAAVLLASDPPPGALGLSELASASSARTRLSVLGRGILPRRRYMETHYAVASTGPPGLAAAYVLRLARLGRHLPSGVRAWRAARGPGR